MWSNDMKYKYMFMFPLQNLACKELTHWGLVKMLTIFFLNFHNIFHDGESCILIHVSLKFVSNDPLTNWWLSGRLQCLQCISNGDTAVLHLTIEIIIIDSMNSLSQTNYLTQWRPQWWPQGLNELIHQHQQHVSHIWMKFNKAQVQGQTFILSW